MMINWKVRLKNKAFWITVIPAIALVVQAVLALFDIKMNFDTLTGKLIAVVDAVFALLVILGIVVDPTTSGIKDSIRAMRYDTPWVDDTVISEEEAELEAQEAELEAQEDPNGNEE